MIPPGFLFFQPGGQRAAAIPKTPDFFPTEGNPPFRTSDAVTIRAGVPGIHQESARPAMKDPFQSIDALKRVLGC
jgi:hypothetical protein